MTCLDADFISELSRDHHRLEYIVKLSDALKGSASVLLARHKRFLEPIASKLSKGIASLPDELLGLIFKFATHHEQEGTRHALWLSQVSRRFRNITLGNQSLWTTQFQWYDLNTHVDIERCVDRCRPDSDLHLVVNYREDLDIRASSEFIDAYTFYTSRWKSLTLVGDWVHTDGGFIPTIGYFMDTLMAECDLELPRLHELHLLDQRHSETENPVWHTDDDDFTLLRTWTTPNLRVLRCTQYIPPPSFQFESITDFSLSLTLLPGESLGQVTYLLTFLSGRSSLAEIDLELVNQDIAGSRAGDEIVFASDVVLESVTSFKFAISNFKLPSELPWLPTPVLKALILPNLAARRVQSPSPNGFWTSDFLKISYSLQDGAGPD